jgi:hypothetical protein
MKSMDFLADGACPALSEDTSAEDQINFASGAWPALSEDASAEAQLNRSPY